MNADNKYCQLDAENYFGEIIFASPDASTLSAINHTSNATTLNISDGNSAEQPHPDIFFNFHLCRQLARVLKWLDHQKHACLHCARRK